jgi:quinol monooxygenase YgiN
MIIVTGTIELDPAHIDKARAAAIEMMAETRKEKGCIVYEFSQLVEAETTFRVYEEWESEAALAAHGQTPHMARFRAALAKVGITGRSLFTIEAISKTPR